MDNDNSWTETDESEVEQESDLMLGFVWHDEEKHWHPVAFSYPDTFSDADVDRLEQFLDRVADELTQAGFTIPEGAGSQSS
ncbi:MAG TPA: hypothetical protein VFB58_03920 [Chloroflexota bacterium]|nr:hypothetical protein [Chloroflexota bacterium]